MLEVRNLVVERDSQIVLQQLNFIAREAELLYITGSNGVGKTTLIRTLCGLVQAEDGEIFWNNSSIKKNSIEYFRNLAYIGHDNGIKGDLTPVENLEIDRSIRQNASSLSYQEILEQVGIAKLAHRPCRFLSAGQKRMVAMGRLLASNLKLWVLDEPLTSLDEKAQTRFLFILQEHLKNQGVVVATSHQELNWQQVRVVTKHLGTDGMLT